MLKLKEKGSAGYAWDFDALENEGFEVSKDDTEIIDWERVGTPSLRKVITNLPALESGEFLLEETCPFPREVPRSNLMRIHYEPATKPKEGIVRNFYQQKLADRK